LTSAARCWPERANGCRRRGSTSATSLSRCRSRTGRSTWSWPAWPCTTCAAAAVGRRRWGTDVSARDRKGPQLELIDLASTARGSVDITLRNSGSLVAVAKRIGFRVGETVRLRRCSRHHQRREVLRWRRSAYQIPPHRVLPPSADYELQISARHGPGSEVARKVSHEIASGTTDRFAVRLVPPGATCACTGSKCSFITIRPRGPCGLAKPCSRFLRSASAAICATKLRDRAPGPTSRGCAASPRRTSSRRLDSRICSRAISHAGASDARIATILSPAC
jgi:hypothetical protein